MYIISGGQMDLTDTDILDRVRGGDADAFAEIVGRYQRPMYDLALRMLGDAGEAEDITQAAFVKMYFSLSSYDRELPFRNWAYTITLNLARNRLRRRSILSFIPFLSEDGGAGAPEPAEAGGDPPARLARRGMREDLERAIAALPADLREAFVLFHLHRVPARDIAGSLGVTPNAVSMRLFKARERLAGELSRVYPEYFAPGKEGI